MKLFMRHATISLLSVLSFTTFHAEAIRISDAEGAGDLVFSNAVDDTYTSLYYENSQGGRLDIFDGGLEFNYDEESDAYLSPDKTHFFVNFSETSSIEDGASSTFVSKEYMCAFVRMSDGCVVQVETGGICGGKWDATSQWVGIDGSIIRDLDMNPPTVSTVFREYSARIKDASAHSSPRILKYLPEGTAFDNLLACDPVSARNQKSYEKLLNLLQRDGDSTNAKKVSKAMGNEKI
jgi:hypothetical protein